MDTNIEVETTLTLRLNKGEVARLRQILEDWRRDADKDADCLPFSGALYVDLSKISEDPDTGTTNAVYAATKKKIRKYKKQKPRAKHFGRGHPKPKAKKKMGRPKTGFDKKAYDQTRRDKKRAERAAAAKAAPGPDNEISDKKMAKMQEIDNGIKKVQKQQDDIYRKERP